MFEKREGSETPANTWRIQASRSSGVKAVQLKWDDGGFDAESSVLFVEKIVGVKDGTVVTGM